MFREKAARSRVAVVGSGLAGLTVAYLLHNDPKQRYHVTILESGSNASLDSASVDIDRGSNGRKTSRVDVPMRAFTGGYYNNLRAMYDHLGVDYHWQKFLFEFSRYQRRSADQEPEEPRFIHASDNHQCPPPRPPGSSLIGYLAELLFVAICFYWFRICCLYIPTESGETLDLYLRRNWMPQRFVSGYLLPLMSAVATCSHEEMLQFPASDVVQYRRLILGQKQYVVTGGVGRVQQRLLNGLDLRLQNWVTRVEPSFSGLNVTVQRADEGGQLVQDTHTYDHVILAVPPNVAAKIFEAGRGQLSRIPVRSLETFVHRVRVDSERSASNSNTDRILLKTSEFGRGWTEATHLHPDGIGVTSCPFSTSEPGEKVLSRSKFTRAIRTIDSRRIVGEILNGPPSGSESKTWRNGDHNAWVVGAWCFDGFVLLEGCVTSAMQVAKALDVEIPWEQRG